MLILITQTIKYTMVKKSVYIDKLTEVYNRNYLQESENLINYSNYIMAALDIDHFKKINDSYGHIVGDKILKQLAQTINETIRKNDDIVIRYGGEEFLILIRTKRENHAKALNSLDRIFQNIQNKKFFISDSESIKVTVSIGVNLNPQDSRTFSEAFKLADISLYNAKNKGRNQIEIYSNEHTKASLLSINEIKHAIDEKRVVCFYQKIINTQTGEDSHYEALLRIKTAKNEIITPDKILPAIKSTFIARNITIEVMDIVYKKLVENKNIKINVNLNPMDILDNSIINILKNYAVANNTICERMGIELIETEEIANYEHAKKNLLMLKNLGYKIFIDDFGSGYSNFIYLTEIKTDYLKIDGNIIKKILNDPTSYLVVKSIVNFAKEANIKIVAEYVCNEEIYEKIKELEIDYSQGYLFSIPSESL
jgi:diguanylate cyclase (GGDEF)-like protein